MRSVLLLLSISLVVIGGSGAVWQTIAGDRLDWEIGDWSVGVFLVSTDPATGARQRLPGFEFSFNFYEVGFWAPRLRSSSEYGVVLPVINVTLASVPNRQFIEAKTSHEGIPYTRYGQEVIIQQNPLDGKNFTFRLFVDVPESDTYVEFLGYKVPLVKSKLKIATEFENYPRELAAGVPFPSPAVYSNAMIHITSTWDNTGFELTNNETWPLFYWDRDRVQYERLPGFPEWDDLPSVIHYEAIGLTGSVDPGYAELKVMDSRGNLTLTLQGFSAANYTGPEINLSPTGQSPVYSVFKAFPPQDILPKMLEYATTLSATGLRSTSLGFQYYAITDNELNVGDKIVWDPDLAVLFALDNGTPEASTEVVAIAVAVPIAAIVVIAVLVILLVPKARRAVLPFADRKDESKNATLEAPRLVDKDPDAFESSSKGWEVGDRKSVLMRNTAAD